MVIKPENLMPFQTSKYNVVAVLSNSGGVDGASQISILDPAFGEELLFTEDTALTLDIGARCESGTSNIAEWGNFDLMNLIWIKDFEPYVAGSDS